MQKYLFIAVGGALGSMARYWVGSTISGRMGSQVPLRHDGINMTACVILGFTLTYFGTAGAGAAGAELRIAGPRSRQAIAGMVRSAARGGSARSGASKVRHNHAQFGAIAVSGMRSFSPVIGE